jgi:glycosyltransferase involved in cell wall biosynthesis
LGCGIFLAAGPVPKRYPPVRFGAGITATPHRKMEMQADISIVIPMRNESSYIGDTLASFRAALDRCAFAYEIVVVDGASTDGSLEHCGLADTIITEREPERSGIARARNIGAANSSGALLFHSDADVRIPLEKDFFDQLIKIFGDPEIVAATGRIVPYPWTARKVDRLWHAVGNRVIQRSHQAGIYLARGEFQVVRSAAFVAAGGYDEKITVGEDWDLFRRISKSGSIYYSADLFVYHSPRRFEACGYGPTFLSYLRELASLLVLKRSYLKEWKAVR